MGNAEHVVSILIPTYNRPEMLKRAVDSVLNQSFKDFIIKISDNGANIETIEYCEQLASSSSKVFYSRNEENIGASGNISKLVSEVDTDFYCILSDDDFIFPDFIATCMSAFLSYPDIAFSCARTVLIDKRSGTLHFRNKDWTKGYYDPSREIVHKMQKSHFTSTGVVFHRRVIDTLGGFHDLGDDRLFLVLASASYSFFVSEDYGAAFIVNDHSLTGSGGIGANTNLTDLCESMILDFSIINSNVEFDLRKEVGAVFLSSYVTYLRQRHQQEKLQNHFSSPEEILLIESLNPIMPSLARTFYRLILERAPRKIQEYILYAVKGWREYRTKRLAARSSHLLDGGLRPYVEGDLTARVDFLREFSARFDVR